MTTKPRRRKRKSRYHTGTHASPKAGDCKYRSGWELLLMQHMDADPGVASYAYESLVIPYVSNLKSGRVRKYFPDFLVTRSDGTRSLVEVKPKKRLSQASVRKKLAAALEWCQANDVALRIITEVELRTMGLLK